ncbi:MAG: DMT family transporter [Bacilli bacterium]|nr:DMT family transporter [Bacilli bacterium]
MSKEVKAHILAFISSIIWGTTFISSKTLLSYFQPIELLFIRFIFGLITLFLLCPKVFKLQNKKDEIYFALAGFSGITLYYLLENYALTYTLASNVGVIISLAPFFTGIIAHFFIEDERMHKNFFIGFVVSMIGVFFISFNGVTTLELNPLGDILTMIAALVWALYSYCVKKISSSYNVIQSTRRMFEYGILFMIPVVLLTDTNIRLLDVFQTKYILHFLFLSVGASAICFVIWNWSVDVLGTMKTSVYIYLVPVITVIASVFFLDEPLTLMSGIGTILALSGLILSEKNGHDE